MKCAIGSICEVAVNLGSISASHRQIFLSAITTVDILGSNLTSKGISPLIRHLAQDIHLRMSQIEQIRCYRRKVLEEFLSTASMPSWSREACWCLTRFSRACNLFGVWGEASCRLNPFPSCQLTTNSKVPGDGVWNLYIPVEVVAAKSVSPSLLTHPFSIYPQAPTDSSAAPRVECRKLNWHIIDCPHCSSWS